MPSHSHQAPDGHNFVVDQGYHTGDGYSAIANGPWKAYYSSTRPTGGGQPMNILNPGIAVNYEVVAS